jgi:hypothetical protein
VKILLILTLASVAAHATPITVFNSSSVSIGGLGRYQPATGLVSTSYNASASATMPAPFQAELQGAAVIPVQSGNSQTEFSRSEASQNSSINGGHIEASGRVYTRSAPATEEIVFLHPYGYASALSIFDVLLHLPETTSFHLTGFAEARAGDLSTLSLSPLSGPPLLNFERNGFLDVTGILDPGIYRLTALTQVVSEGNRYDTDFGYADFNFVANFVPAAVADTGSTLGLLGLALLTLILCRNHGFKFSSPLKNNEHRR